MCGRIFNYFVTRNLLLSLSIKYFENWLDLAKLEAKLEWFHFFGQGVYIVSTFVLYLFSYASTCDVCVFGEEK